MNMSNKQINLSEILKTFIREEKSFPHNSTIDINLYKRIKQFFNFSKVCHTDHTLHFKVINLLEMSFFEVVYYIKFTISIYSNASSFKKEDFFMFSGFLVKKLMNYGRSLSSVIKRLSDLFTERDNFTLYFNKWLTENSTYEQHLISLSELNWIISSFDKEKDEESLINKSCNKHKDYNSLIDNLFKENINDKEVQSFLKSKTKKVSTPKELLKDKIIKEDTLAKCESYDDPFSIDFIYSSISTNDHSLNKSEINLDLNDKEDNGSLRSHCVLLDYYNLDNLN